MTITDVALVKLKAVFEAKHSNSNFGNGRGARKLIEECDIPCDLKGSASASQKIGFAC